MADPSLLDNPRALPGAPAPTVERLAVAGTHLYAEVRGTGPAILLVPGGGEDAEGWRPVAERLLGHTVVTYDRRGTLRSGRDDWPGQGSAQHADDAAALLRALGLGEAVIVGASSAEIIALQVALRHPGLVRRVLAYEPGYFRAVPRGASLHDRAAAAVRAHLAGSPEDWAGAYEAFGREFAASVTSSGDAPLAAPGGEEWYARREERNAEPLVRDDILILTAETPDEPSLAASPVEIRLASGTGSVDLFREIAEHLAGVRDDIPDTIERVGHSLYLHPEETVAYFGTHSGS